MAPIRSRAQRKPAECTSRALNTRRHGKDCPLGRALSCTRRPCGKPKAFQAFPLRGARHLCNRAFLHYTPSNPAQTLPIMSWTPKALAGTPSRAKCARGRPAFNPPFLDLCSAGLHPAVAGGSVHRNFSIAPEISGGIGDKASRSWRGRISILPCNDVRKRFEEGCGSGSASSGNHGGNVTLQIG